MVKLTTKKQCFFEGLKISSSRDEDCKWIEVPKTRTKRYLPVSQDDIAAPSKLNQWRYFSKRDDISVGLLIGANCIKDLEPPN